jgi:hypothetical protein
VEGFKDLGNKVMKDTLERDVGGLKVPIEIIKIMLDGRPIFLDEFIAKAV